MQSSGSKMLFRVSETGYLTIPIATKEQYLTPDVEVAFVQAIGTDLQVLIPSDNDDLLIRLPLRTWETSPPYQRSLGRNGIHIEAWRRNLKTRFMDNGHRVMGTLRRLEVDHDLLQ